MFTVEHLSAVASDNTPILSDIEFREVMQMTIATCYDMSLHLGSVADYWADAFFSNDAAPSLTALGTALGITVTAARALLAQVRNVSRRVHQDETGLPATW
ncbi:hypothetical protein [Curtobacterium sp. MCBD17_040]|uniref:hypothetical protein n=1 Tax=Curtobacterium sp. MCBD17_040 TaxID=2175674 RepID=UPI000DA8F3A9|nr:hypothetical protein [Curtobacterium sp. MCBD17_040]WIB65524.1 hypothetical protein DEI94_19310 [Curtobacterium sp. MCBD17_040]